jgi:photosynthetic reaction center H subunit
MAEEKRLYNLKELTKYEVADGDPDVRGWSVYTSNNVKFGVVEDLIVDTAKMKVRYLDIDVDDDVSGVTDDHHLLVPIGAASIDAKEDKVFIRTIETKTLLKSPPYKGAITRDYEDNVRGVWGTRKTSSAEQDYYEDDEYYDEDRFFGPRRRIPR